jgi:tetratricopeptide (TPR) repeat protein/predicted Ser/Thr protein kinase
VIEPVPDSLIARLEGPSLVGDPLEIDRVRAAVTARLLGDTVPETRIDRFVVLGQLGVGGMGVVYAAYDPELDRKVAIKLVRVSGRALQPQDQERLVREARALARLSHPNVVAVYEVGLHGESVFLAMEFVRGPTLRSYAAARRSAWRDVVHAYLQAGAGLAAAHERGLVHRDFKPDNAIVGDDGRVRVVDFGLARGEPTMETTPKTSDARSSGDSPLTVTGTMLGTPAYMAPEQRLGLPTGPSTDQYAFCASLFEALTGGLPLPAEHHADVTSALPQSLPLRLRRALARGLARIPEDRFADMEALAGELRGSTERSRSVRVPVFAAALVGVAAVGAAAVWLGDARDPCPEPSEELAKTWGATQRATIAATAAELGEVAVATAAVVERELDARSDAWIAGRRDACEALYVRRSDSPELFDRRMRCLERARAAMGETIAFLGDGDAATWERAVQTVVGLAPVGACADVDVLPAELAVREPEAAATVDRLRGRIDRGKTLIRLGRFAEGEALADEVVVEATSIGDRPLEAEALQLRAGFDGAQHRDEESTAHLEDALWRAEAGHADELAVSLIAALVSDAVQRGQLDAAEALDRRLVGAIERLGRPSRTEIVVARARGMLAKARDRPDDAEAHLRAGIDASRRWSGVGSLDEGRQLNMLGTLQFERGEYVAAAESFESVLVIHRAWLGDVHPEMLGYRINLASTYDRLGRMDEAKTMLETVVADGERVLTGPSPTLSGALDNLASIHQQAGRSDLALPLCERSVAVLESTVGRDDPRLLSTLNVLANVYADLERNGEARATLERILETSTRTGREDDTKAIALANLTDLEVEAGESARARTHAAEALALWIRLHGEDHPVTGEFTGVLARVELADDAVVDATTHARRAIAQLERGGDFHAKALADARFVLARALVRSRGPAGRDEAIGAARTALAAYEFEERGDDAKRVRTWLAAQASR